MGKASKWFRGLLGLKKLESDSPKKTSKEKRRWSFVKSFKEKDNTNNNNASHTNTNTPSHPNSKEAVVREAADPNKHAIAVAAATAAVAEAAVAAAQAAAVVVRLTSSSGRCGGGFRTREDWAAVKIQAAFRGCLARRALRALKGLVKLQALVRGHIERKRTSEWLKRMQAVLRAQARVCAGRAHMLQTPNPSTKSSMCHLHGPATPDKFESPVRAKSMKHEHSPTLMRIGSKSIVQINSINQEKCGDHRSDSNERSDRNLDIDSGISHATSKRRSLIYSTTSHASVSDHYSKSFTTTTSLQSSQSPSCEVRSYSPLKINGVEESTPFCTANNSPQYLSASSKDNDGSRRSPFTSARTDGSRSFLCGYPDYPSYMAYTESSKAKVRSLSAPRQRPQYERSSSSSNRHSPNGFGESKLAAQRVSTLQSSFTSKAYPGSGRLDKLGMPVGYRF